jgi:hypothetical protein
MDRWNIHARSPLTSLLQHLHQNLSGFRRIAHFTQECDAGAPHTTLGYSSAHENRGGPQLRFQEVFILPIVTFLIAPVQVNGPKLKI